jgi:signal transduction histidine kinase
MDTRSLMQPRKKLLALFTLCTLLALGSTAAQQDGPPAASLPVSRVVLFTSGVGFFEHAGVVDGTQQLTLSVAADQMDDLLQSLVLLDHDGGSIREVRYPADDPLQRILASYPLDLTHGPSLLQLLAQARGEPVQLNAAGPLSGTILGVESTPAEDSTTRDYLLLLTAEGLMRIALDEVRDLNFENAELRAQLHAALDAIARYRHAEDKALQLLFSGSGERAVSVAYVREMPLWKASYRLVLDGDTAQLQGWAIFDNPTSLDLNDISVSFVAGQPLSFITDLFAPIHVQRPRVRTAAAPGIVPPPSVAGIPMAAPAAQSAAPALRSSLDASTSFSFADQLLESGVDTAAAGVQSGAGFEYRVAEPVTIGRYESALIPVLQETVPMQRVSVFDASVLAAHPLLSVQVDNDTDLHLAAGSSTIFDAGIFAGNARFNDILPGGSALLSYAVDQAVDVQVDTQRSPRVATAVKLVNGLLSVSMREVATSEYRISGSADDRLLAVEHPQLPGFDLVQASPLPLRTDSGYRFGVKLSAAAEAGPADPAGAGTDPDLPVQLHCVAGQPCTLTITEERLLTQELLLTNVSADDIVYYLANVDVSDADRQALQQVQALKAQLSALTAGREDAEAQRNRIAREQDRIRSNMATLARDSDLYKRYVAQLQEQEDQLAALGAEWNSFNTQLQQVQRELDGLLRGLGAE